MALKWPQFDHNHVMLHYFSIVLATLFSENFKNFRNLEAKIWPIWSEHSPNIGKILPQYPFNSSTLTYAGLYEVHIFSAKQDQRSTAPPL